MSKLLQNTTDLQAILAAINELPENSEGGGESTVETGELTLTKEISAPGTYDYVLTNKNLDLSSKYVIVLIMSCKRLDDDYVLEEPLGTFYRTDLSSTLFKCVEGISFRNYFTGLGMSITTQYNNSLTIGETTEINTDVYYNRTYSYYAI